MQTGDMSGKAALVSGAAASLGRAAKKYQGSYA